MAQSPEFSIDLGGKRVTLLSGGALRLDGGAMFGIIPKPLWSRNTPTDDQNRIQLACNCLFVEFDGSDRRVIIETGHGPKYAEKERSIFVIDPSRWLLTDLVARGIEPDSITDVVVTHLHFDHAGGLTCVRNERVEPTFPRAGVHVQQQEFDDARANFGIMHATYREENFSALDAASAWRLHHGDDELLPGIRAIRTPGHTRGHQSILIRGRDRTLAFAGDVMPTRAHVGAPYNMGYDLFPIDNRDSKRRILSQIADEQAVLVIDHEPTTPVVTVRRDGAWFALDPIQAPPARSD